METFGEEISAEACSGKEIAGLLRKIIMMMMMNKWKNHFYEMKGDVGMSLHEKKGTRRCLHQDTKSLITPSLHLCFALTCCLFVCYECII